MTRIAVLGVAAMVVLCGCSGSGGAAQILIGAVLMDGSSQPPVAHSVVVVKDGRIAAMGPGSEVAIPTEGTQFHLQGKYIFPLDPASPMRVGGPADLIVVRVNPATDPNYLKQTSGRMQEGRWIQYPQ